MGLFLANTKILFLKRIKRFLLTGSMVLGLACGYSSGQGEQALTATPASSDNSQNASNPNSRFALNVKDVNLRDLLALLMKNSDYSLIMDPGIDAVIPVLDLKSVTFEEALKSVLPGLGLEYKFDGNLLRIRKPAMQTRLFYLNYIAASRSGKRDMRMSSRSQSGGSSGGASGSGSSASGGSSGGSGGSGGGSSSENESTIITANSSEVWEDLRLGLESILFSGEAPEPGVRQESGPVTTASKDSAGRRLLINPQAGLIMVHGEAEKLDEAANYIEAVEGSVQRQVLIEAKVVEVSLSKDHQMGINWTAVLNPTSAFTGQITGNAIGVTNPSIGFNSGTVSNQNVSSSAGRFLYSISNGKVGMAIEALERQGQVRVLSSPHISAMNNQKAIIRVVREEVFFAQKAIVTQNTGSTVVVEDIENQVVPIGVVLDIIPQIAANGEITLSINPSISELVESRTFSTPEGKAVSTQPVIDRRDLDTVAKVHSGETVLIAGIMRERKWEDLRGLPWLMNLPFVGNAFRRTEQSSSRTELVIFITPTLISGKSMEQLTQEELQKLKELEQPFKLGTIEPIKKGLKAEMGKK
jgi:MSHA biogenesis protein MshL